MEKCTTKSKICKQRPLCSLCSYTFVPTVGREHPLRKEAQDFFIQSRGSHKTLFTSAEVAQELLHAYLPAGRMKTLDAAFELLCFGIDRIFDITIKDVRHACNLINLFPNLTARDLLHLSVCQRHNITKIKSYDQAINNAFSKRSQ